jgi:hypothetical protein
MTTDNFCCYLQNRLIQASQTGGQWYSATSPLGFPALRFSPVAFVLSGKSHQKGRKFSRRRKRSLGRFKPTENSIKSFVFIQFLRTLFVCFPKCFRKQTDKVWRNYTMTKLFIKFSVSLYLPGGVFLLIENFLPF